MFMLPMTCILITIVIEVGISMSISVGVVIIHGIAVGTIHGIIPHIHGDGVVGMTLGIIALGVHIIHGMVAGDGISDGAVAGMTLGILVHTTAIHVQPDTIV